MAKKLKVELDVDTSKAKKKIQQDLDTSAPGGTVGGGGGGGGGGVSTASPAMERTARQIRQLGDSAGSASIDMKAAGKAFAGMAVGLAASYAARHMSEGKGRTAVEYGAGMMQGASMGMMFGPWGAAAGAAGGFAKTYLDRDAAQAKAIEDFQKYDDGYQEGRLWDKQMRELTDVTPSAVGMSNEDANKDQREKVEAKINQARERAFKLFDDENRLVDQINAALKKGYSEEAANLEEQLKLKRARREQVEGIQRAFEKQKASLVREDEERRLKEQDAATERTSMSATDALGKVGAGFGAGVSSGLASEGGASPASGRWFGGFSVAARKTSDFRFGNTATDDTSKAIKAANEILQRQNDKMIEALKEIERNTKGGDAWQ